MKVLATLGLSSILVLAIGCAKDKNMDDYRRDQLQQNIERINSVSGSYSGAIVAKNDRTNLGAINLTFNAQTNITSNSSQVSNEQMASISGSVTIKGLTEIRLNFVNGTYNDVNGFQATIKQGPTDIITLKGTINGNRWVGTIEAPGQEDFGGNLDLQKNAPMSNTSAIEVGGVRLQQIKDTNYSFVGSYKSDGQTYPVQLNFLNNDNSPEENILKLFSLVRKIKVDIDFSGFELLYTDVTLDDTTNTLSGRNPIGQDGKVTNATLDCRKYQDGNDFGWDCILQTKTKLLPLHLSAKKSKE